MSKHSIKIIICSLFFMFLFGIPAYSIIIYPTRYDIPYGEFLTLKIPKDQSLVVSKLVDLNAPSFYCNPSNTTILRGVHAQNAVIYQIVADEIIDIENSYYSINLLDGHQSKVNILRVDEKIAIANIANSGPKRVYGNPLPPIPSPEPDLSEGIATKEGTQPTDLVIINPNAIGQVMTSPGIAYDTRIAGIIARDPAMYIHKKEGYQPLALAGRVYCKVSNEGGPIQRGDLLVSSSTPGHVMKGDPAKITYGTIVGKALQTFEQSETSDKENIILVLVNVQ